MNRSYSCRVTVTETDSAPGVASTCTCPSSIVVVQFSPLTVKVPAGSEINVGAFTVKSGAKVKWNVVPSELHAPGSPATRSGYGRATAANNTGLGDPSAASSA